ncbi:MAG: SpoIID/LytB domain-containing protein [Candidatus Omnitrophota bacterium]
MKKLFFFLVLFGTGFLCGGSFSEGVEKNNPTVRVLILQQAKEIKLTIHSSYKIISRDNTRELLSGKWLSERMMLVSSNMLHLGEYVFDTDAVVVRALKDGRISVNGRYYRGDIVVSKKEGLLSVINILDIEDYLKGVLFHEVSPKWPIEVLRAQAIVARTFAYYQSMVNKKKEYDVTSDTLSQVYGGLFSEKLKTNIAVDVTRGEILTYDGKVFPAYYHATCGGMTEDSSVLWNIDIPPLRGTKCDLCNDSPHLAWNAKIALADIERKLRENGFYINGIEDIAIISYTPSGRVYELLIRSQEKEARISAKQFRQVLGSTLIRSAHFSVYMNGDFAIFKGLGWGHGVGMCQWGAKYLAELGKKASYILKFYYPESETMEIKEIAAMHSNIKNQSSN